MGNESNYSSRWRGERQSGVLPPNLLDDVLGVLEERLRLIVREELRALVLSHPPLAPSNSPVFLSVARAAEVAGVRGATIREWVARGKLRGYRAGRLLRVRLDEVERFLGETRRGDPNVVDIEERKRKALERLK